MLEIRLKIGSDPSISLSADLSTMNELSTSQISTSTQKKIKVRPALIADDDNDDDGIEIVKAKPPKKEKSKPSSAKSDGAGNQEHLKTKKQIEDLRKEYGDEWLHSKEVQDVMGIQAPFKISSQTTEERLENLFGLESTSRINRDQTSTPIQQLKHADFAHSPIEVWSFIF